MKLSYTFAAFVVVMTAAGCPPPGPEPECQPLYGIPCDAGTPAADAGAPVVDAGQPAPDAGVVAGEGEGEGEGEGQ